LDDFLKTATVDFHDYPMTAPGISIQLGEGFANPGSDRVQMNVPYELFKIVLILGCYRFKPF
jgi:hypothetical protein